MEIIKKYKRCLNIVDMVNGFVREGVLHDENISKIIPRQIELIEEAKEKGSLIIFIKDTHHKDSVEFVRFGNTAHCLENTEESELVEELKPFEKEGDIVCIRKNSTSFTKNVSDVDVLRPDFQNEAINIKITVSGMGDFPMTTEINVPMELVSGRY